MDFLLVIIEFFSLAVMLVELRLESAVLEGGGSLGRKLQVEGDIPHQPVFTQTLQRTFFERNPFLYVNEKIVALEAPLGCSSWAHCKALTELLLVIIELFSLDPTVEQLRANIE